MVHIASASTIFMLFPSTKFNAVCISSQIVYCRAGPYHNYRLLAKTLKQKTTLLYTEPEPSKHISLNIQRKIHLKNLVSLLKPPTQMYTSLPSLLSIAKTQESCRTFLDCSGLMSASVKVSQ